MARTKMTSRKTVQNTVPRRKTGLDRQPKLFRRNVPSNLRDGVRKKHSRPGSKVLR